MSYIGRAPTDTGEFQQLDQISASFDGSERSFELAVGTSAVTPTKENIIIALDGVLQTAGDAYSVSGSTITFSEAPASGISFYGIQTGQVGASIPNSTITNDHVSGTANISGSKINTDFGAQSVTAKVFSGGVMSGSAQTAANLPTGVISGSGNLSASLPPGTMSGSAQTKANLPTGTVSASMGVSGSAVSTGSFGSAIFMGNVNIGTVTANVSASVHTTGSMANLTISGSVFPEGDNFHDLGSANYRWAGIYTTDLELSNKGVKGNDIDGTSGHWTIQEGKENLYLINNETNKKFKFKLEEIE